MSQFAGVKVRGLFTVASPVSLEVIVITTSEVGCASRTMVKVSVAPSSETLVDPPDSTMVNPAVSSSVVVADTVWSSTASKVSSESASTTATVRVEVIVPSTRLSSTPVTVNDCGVFQFSDVNVKVLFLAVEPLTTVSPVSPDAIDRTTFSFSVGCAVRTTAKVSVVPV